MRRQRRQGCQKAMLHGDYTPSPVNGFVCECARDFMSVAVSVRGPEEPRLELHPSRPPCSENQLRKSFLLVPTDRPDCAVAAAADDDDHDDDDDTIWTICHTQFRSISIGPLTADERKNQGLRLWQLPKVCCKMCLKSPGTDVGAAGFERCPRTFETHFTCTSSHFFLHLLVAFCFST